MGTKIFLDTGVMTLFFAKNIHPKIESIKKQLESNELNAITTSPILVEVFFQICKYRGKEFAHKCLLRIEDELLVQRIPTERKIEENAGELKCQYRTKLSYNDCIVMACSIQENATLYTTEKELPEIPRLNVKKIMF